MLRSLIVAALLYAAASAPAHAQVGLDSIFQGPWNVHAAPGSGLPHRSVSRSRNYSASVIGGRPAGCPHAYCGCASARFVNLRASWNVNLAANWLYLQSAQPGPGMAAARVGHVKIIVASLGNGLYKFYDPNSGGHATRYNVGSLAGYKVVNPHSHWAGGGRRYAGNGNYVRRYGKIRHHYNARRHHPRYAMVRR